MSEQRPEGCQNCTKQCTVFFTQIVGNKTTKLAMCSDCPNAKKLEVGDNFGLLSQILGVLTPVALPAHSQRCATCGLTWADFQKTQLFGCPACYENHAANLAQLMPRLQPGSEHRGKIPEGFQNVRAKEMVEAAKAKLPKAIAEENYELAAKLRDEIKALEKIMGESPEAPPAE